MEQHRLLFGRYFYRCGFIYFKQKKSFIQTNLSILETSIGKRLVHNHGYIALNISLLHISQGVDKRKRKVGKIIYLDVPIGKMYTPGEVSVWSIHLLNIIIMFLEGR